MKSWFLFIFLMIVYVSVLMTKKTKLSKDSPLLVVVLMVKNEASVICPTLQPFVDAGVDSYFIFDTGSTDGTPEVVADYFKKNGIKHGYVAQEPFVDFATSRNRALELAEQQFPGAHYMIMLDAEWYLKGADKLVAFCKKHMYDLHAKAYLVRINTSILDFFLPRLIRPHAHLRFEGPVHEYLKINNAYKMPEDICFEVRQGEIGVEATKKRLLRDLDILQKEHVKNPNDTRTIHFLGQTSIGLKRWEDAYKFFRLCVRRTVINDKTERWKREQTYQASYNSAVIAAEFAKTTVGFSWELALSHFLEAFSICPTRAEPLVRIAEHYWQEGNMPLCFLFVRRAAELPFPVEATGLVEKEIYEFYRYDLLAGSSANINEWSIAEWATRVLLEKFPGKEALQKNLERILERKAVSAAAPERTYYVL